MQARIGIVPAEQQRLLVADRPFEQIALQVVDALGRDAALELTSLGDAVGNLIESRIVHRYRIAPVIAEDLDRRMQAAIGVASALLLERAVRENAIRALHAHARVLPLLRSTQALAGALARLHGFLCRRKRLWHDSRATDRAHWLVAECVVRGVLAAVRVDGRGFPAIDAEAPIDQRHLVGTGARRTAVRARRRRYAGGIGGFGQGRGGRSGRARARCGGSTVDRVAALARERGDEAE